MTTQPDRILTLPDGRRFLKLDSGLLLTQLAELKKGSYYGAVIGRIHGYERNDIEPLLDVHDLQGIHIQDEIADLSALTRLTSLRYILVTSPKQKIDFSVFPLLEELRIGEWNSNATGVNECQRLERLYARNVHPPGRSLDMLAAPNLREMEIVQSPLARLEGLNSFRNLNSLVIRYFTKLVDLSDLRQVKSSLRKLVLDRCKKIGDFEVIGDLVNLRNLAVNTCSDIASIHFVSRLRNLETIGFLDTNIKDGDLSPLLTLEKLIFVGVTDKKHYSHKSAQLKKELEKRSSSR